MKNLFDQLSFDISKKVTTTYSTSFSLGILALHPSIRPAIYAIYGYVRLADEIVDSFHHFDKEKLLNQLKSETYEAINHKISINPILNSFQEVVNKYDVDHKLINQFLHSMEMDLKPITYTDANYKEYIVGSAEVVGLMCLQIFVNGNKDEFERLKPYATTLGSAFQKINFLRDLKDDYQVLGRSYFPNVDLEEFNNEIKKQLENEIEEEFKYALIGIKKLPSNSKFGVYLAYKYYWSLFNKIKRTCAKKILNNRVRIHNGEKISLMMSSYVQYKMTRL
ncbi:phytoene/squalene synthase family protein [Faecalibacter rhinopitheci]|uniref:Phytoene/squalene synthase family protein n=1 Tax=Faecalibacter rhinopitheci TaxID=2779678 RepID=A0A8J7FTD3_9FLAO|nr:phytoene/squalene synthase family protein [Faecalibacter rhinopitheci]MBF0596126.1 phytoene/squalene synthase family protein [Faecalibacter rhinopitheci]